MFTKNEVTTVRQDILAAIAPVLAKHGLTVADARGTYGDSLAVKITFAREGTDPGAEDFNRWAPLYGLPADAHGKVITVAGTKFTITGFNTRARTMPVIGKDANGRSFKFKVVTVKRALGLPVEAWEF